jgi:hypothetical protein
VTISSGTSYWYEAKINTTWRPTKKIVTSL